MYPTEEVKPVFAFLQTDYGLETRLLLSLVCVVASRKAERKIFQKESKISSELKMISQISSLVMNIYNGK
jgi:hypothetical protein